MCALTVKHLSAKTVVMDEEFETFLLIMFWPFVLKVMYNYYFLRISGQWMESFQIKSLKYEDLIILSKDALCLGSKVNGNR